MDEPELDSVICMPDDIFDKVYEKVTKERPQKVQLSEKGKETINSLVELLTSQTESFKTIAELVNKALPSSNISSKEPFEFIAENAEKGFRDMDFDKLIIDFYNKRVLFVYKSVVGEVPYRVSIAFSNGVGEDNGTFYKVALNLYQKVPGLVNGKEQIINYNIAAVNLYIGSGAQLELGIFPKGKDFKAIHSVNKKYDPRISSVGASFKIKMQQFLKMV